MWSGQPAQRYNMPFQSQAQRGYLYANHPEVAKEFEAHTPKGKKLPAHKGDHPAMKGLKAAKPKSKKHPKNPEHGEDCPDCMA